MYFKSRIIKPKVGAGTKIAVELFDIVALFTFRI